MLCLNLLVGKAPFLLLFGQDTGVTPLLFTRSTMRFLMTTASQDLGLTSHTKDGIHIPYEYRFICLQLNATTAIDSTKPVKMKQNQKRKTRNVYLW